MITHNKSNNIQPFVAGFGDDLVQAPRTELPILDASHMVGEMHR